MLRISGMVIQHSTYTPKPTPEEPSPSTFRALVVEGVRVGLPEDYREKLPPIGSMVEVVCTAKTGQRGLSISLLSIPDAITSIS